MCSGCSLEGGVSVFKPVDRCRIAVCWGRGFEIDVALSIQEYQGMTL